MTGAASERCMPAQSMDISRRLEERVGFPKLQPEDVSRLLRDPSESNRARIARKVGVGFASDTLTTSERALAEDIIRLLARDTVVRVRVALADAVKSTPALPHDVALRLAHDVEEVALPILQYSLSLTDDDLIDIVRGGDPARQSAVAGRPTVSGAVSDTLIDHGDEFALLQLMNNKRAEIAQDGFSRALNRFGNRRLVPDAMARRQQLPAEIVVRLINLVSEGLQTQLVARYHLTPTVAKDVAVKTKERAAKALYSSAANSTDPFLRAREMLASRRLTPQVILRALCLGDLPFFEACLAVMADIPLTNARILVRDSGVLGLKSLLHKANIPIKLLAMFRVALAIARELDADLEPEEFFDRRRDIALKALASHEDTADEDVDMLLSRMDSYAVVPDSLPEIVHYGG